MGRGGGEVLYQIKGQRVEDCIVLLSSVHGKQLGHVGRSIKPYHTIPGQAWLDLLSG